MTQPPAPLREPRRRITLEDVLVNVILVAVGLMFVLPLLWLILAAFDAKATWSIHLPDLTLDNLQQVVNLPNGLRSLANSLYVAVTTTLVATSVSFLAAYALSRSHLPAKGPVMYVILFAAGLPIIMLLVPIYRLYVLLGWLDSLFTTSLFLAALSVPFSIWLLTNFINSIPIELEQAAQIEGTGTLTMLRRVLIPLASPGIAVAAIYTFINAWGAFIVPLVLNQTPGDQPGSTKVFFFLGTQGVIEFGGLAMFSLLFAIPVLVLYWLGSRFFSGSFAFEGGVRG